MDWIIWVIVIVVIVGVVWWLLNRNSSGNTTGTPAASDSGMSVPQPRQSAVDRPAGGGAAASADAAATAGMPGAAGFSQTANASPSPSVPAEPGPDLSPTANAAPGGGDVDDWDDDAEATSGAPAADTGLTTTADVTAKPEGTAAGPEAAARTEDKAEWEAQWSEAASTPHADQVHTKEVPTRESAAGETPAAATGQQVPVHHPEYTEHHAPTLPGAESAAAEDVQDTNVKDPGADAGLPPASGSGTAAVSSTAGGSSTEVLSEGDAETMQAAASSAATEAAASHTAEPAGHLAADKPYGEGSAAPGPDGSGPDGYTVKGNAQSMIYHDETSPGYEETTAEVWFESAAHAEAAGFRAPRRSRH
ncbi:sunset domain-containing protein [Arthrobacter sp. LjRoot14]|uniref:sunset domain-containing protein n=1 Tax=Arthrobacter sp. LjRoot14 TaxID=3342265 RepID=UPI003ED0002A